MSSEEPLIGKLSTLFLRLALGISFLSAVADRFGFWGAYGQPNVSWGNFVQFLSYTAKVLSFLPVSAIPILGIAATGAEIILGFLLVFGWKTRMAALFSGILLAAFALAMTISLGVKAPLSYSVFSAAGGAFLLALCPQYPFSIDSVLSSNRTAE